MRGLQAEQDRPTAPEAISERQDSTAEAASPEDEEPTVPGQITLREVREWVAVTPEPGEVKEGVGAPPEGIQPLERSERSRQAVRRQAADDAAASAAQSLLRVESQDVKLSIGTIHVAIEAPEQRPVRRDAPARTTDATVVRQGSRLGRHYLNID